MSRYKVVEFSEETGKPVEAVPASWLIGEDQVQWPSKPGPGLSLTRLSNLIKHAGNPDDNQDLVWKTVKCRILFCAGKYFEHENLALKYSAHSMILTKHAEVAKFIKILDNYREARRATKKATVSTDIELTDNEGLLKSETRVLRKHQVKKVLTENSVVSVSDEDGDLSFNSKFYLIEL